MGFELFEQGLESLRNDDNLEWIDKTTCWVERERGYNIYIFQVVVNSQEEIEKFYGTITASIAIYFQAELEKAIEKWNIYLVFESRESVDWEIKAKVEQDKYSTRKMVWDKVGEGDIGNKEYLRKRLFSLEIEKKIETPEKQVPLLQKIEEYDSELYKILQKKNFDLEQKIAIYIGDGANE